MISGLFSLLNMLLVTALVRCLLSACLLVVALAFPLLAQGPRQQSPIEQSTILHPPIQESAMATEEQPLELRYYMDPLCGWCYGFGPVVLQLQEKWGEQLAVEIVPGYMIRGARVQPIAEMADYLKSAYPRVEQVAGVAFSQTWLEEIVERGVYISNSEPPCRAMLTYQDLGGKQVLAFADAVSRSLYVHGQDLNTDAPYQQLAQEFGLDAEAFLSHFHSSHMQQQSREAERRARRSGVQGFPQLHMKVDGQWLVVSNGYSSLAELQKRLAPYLSTAAATRD